MSSDLTYKIDKLKYTSKEWCKQDKYSHFEIMDPDGWDRKNYDYSFNQEKITQEEFEKRVMYSTCMLKKDK